MYDRTLALDILRQIDSALGLRDVIAHRYFDIDAEQVWWVCTHEVDPLAGVIATMIDELSA